MEVFDSDLVERLMASAKSSGRLRSHYNMHKSYDEPVQRLFICLCRGTFIPPHSHLKSHQWEYFQVISGCVKLIIFDKLGFVSHIELLGDKQSTFAVQIPPGTYHTLICCSESAFVLEVKQGPFDGNNAKFLPAWSCDENSCDAVEESVRLEALVVGEHYVARKI